MSKINTTNWKEFEVGLIFPKIITPKVYHTREVKESFDGIPYVVRSKFNNGIKYLVEKDDKFTMNPGGVISFGAENSQFFYQEKEYISGRDMYYIDTRHLSKETCLFIASCLNTLTSRYAYNYGLFPSLLKKEKILLPVDSSGEPDWAFMDSYISNQRATIQKKFNKIYKLKVSKTKKDFSKWASFKLEDLFIITGSSTTPKNDLEFVEDGLYPYVTTAATNNGIAGFTNIYTEEGNVLTVDSAVAGTCFYQEKNFTASDHVEKLIPKFTMTKNIGLFLSTIINAAGKPLNYAYNEKRSQTALKKESILLPVDSNGNPDWEYMETYIERMSAVCSDSFAELTKLVKNA